jgi:phospholipase/carboxylesterase
MTYPWSQTPNSRAAAQGRLLARPAPSIMETTQTGLLPLELSGRCDAFLAVPASYQPRQPVPFILMLHGAGGTARAGLTPLLPLIEELGVLALAVGSREQTWDALLDSYGPDVSCIDQALAYTFRHYSVDSSHLAIGGFSDGASYALSLGLINGDLFRQIIAFSPGFIVPGKRHGVPYIYVSHGTHDNVLPINRCSRRLVPQLQRWGYDVHYHEFDGTHTIPLPIAHEAAVWFLGRKQ